MQFSEHFAFITKLWACFWRSDCAWDVPVSTLCAKRKGMFVNPSRRVRFANKANKNMAPGVKKLAAFTLHVGSQMDSEQRDVLDWVPLNLKPQKLSSSEVGNFLQQYIGI